SVLDRNFLPHMGRVPGDRREKGLFLAEIATRIIEVKLGRKTPDDKDHYANKRLKLAGSLLAELFRISFRNLTRDLKYQLERITIRRHIEFSIANAIRPGIITERLCTDETPEGSNCGLVKNLALSSSISVGIDPKEIVDKLHRMGVTPVEESDKRLRATGGKVVVDGIIAGYSKDPVALADELREYRRQGKM